MTSASIVRFRIDQQRQSPVVRRRRRQIHMGAPLTLLTTVLLLMASCCQTVTSSSTGSSNSGTASADAAVPEEAEPSDGAVLRAVVSSMRAYYWRRRHQRHQRDASAPESNRTSGRRRRKRDEEVVCYAELGCFRDDGPFDYLDTLPAAPERIRTQFLLYTAANPAQPVHLHYANRTSLGSALFNRSRDTKVMVHGFGSSCNKRWAVDIRKALLHVESCNVICVDWAEGAALPNYVQAAANTRVVGKQVARLIEQLGRVRGANASTFHLIGFSLGAHVVGFAGHDVRNISRITGLDPAAPLFEGYAAEARLDPGDAAFVDVIHSNGESLLYGGLGAFEPMGHVDYYPNGGKVQGGCSNFFVGAISDLISSGQSRQADGRSLCNHRRAYKFFADSVLPNCRFPAFACDDYEAFLRGDCFACQDKSDCGNMGYFADKSPGRGKLYLITRDAEPFCSNQLKVIIESSPGLAPTYGGLELTLVNWNNVNETFQVTSEWEQLVSGRPLTRVIVASPTLTNIVSAHIRYAPYKGWITSGSEHWAVDRITVVDSIGRRSSFCRQIPSPSEAPPTGTTTTLLLANDKCAPTQLPPPAPGIQPMPTAHGPPPPPQALFRPDDITWPLDAPITKHGAPFHKKPIYQVAPPTSLSRDHPLKNRKNDTSDKTRDKLHHLKDGNKPYAHLKNQVLYFQFFPLPTRQSDPGLLSNNSSSESVQRRLRPVGMRTPRLRFIPLQHPPQAKVATRFNAKVGTAPTGSGGTYRLGRNFGVERVVSAAGPDIGAQIVFVPGGHRQRKLYIPLRAPSEWNHRSGNSSGRVIDPHRPSVIRRISPVLPLSVRQRQQHAGREE